MGFNKLHSLFAACETSKNRKQDGLYQITCRGNLVKFPFLNGKATREKSLKRLEHLARYLRSDHWQRLSRNMLARHSYCQACGKWEKTLIVHHITYERIGNENLDDLAVLCLSCHLMAHQQPPEDLKLLESESVDDFSQD